MTLLLYWKVDETSTIIMVNAMIEPNNEVTL